MGESIATGLRPGRERPMGVTQRIFEMVHQKTVTPAYRARVAIPRGRSLWRFLSDRPGLRFFCRLS